MDASKQQFGELTAKANFLLAREAENSATPLNRYFKLENFSASGIATIDGKGVPVIVVDREGRDKIIQVMIPVAQFNAINLTTGRLAQIDDLTNIKQID